MLEALENLKYTQDLAFTIDSQPHWKKFSTPLRFSTPLEKKSQHHWKNLEKFSTHWKKLNTIGKNLQPHWKKFSTPLEKILNLIEKFSTPLEKILNLIGKKCH